MLCFRGNQFLRAVARQKSFPPNIPLLDKMGHRTAHVPLCGPHTPCVPFPCRCPSRTHMSSGRDFLNEEKAPLFRNGKGGGDEIMACGNRLVKLVLPWVCSLLRLADFCGAPRRALAKIGARRQAHLAASAAGSASVCLPLALSRFSLRAAGAPLRKWERGASGGSLFRPLDAVAAAAAGTNAD